MIVLKDLVNLSASDFESIWRNVSDQFIQRRHWVEELDVRLAAVEDTRVDKVGTAVSDNSNINSAMCKIYKVKPASTAR